MPINIDIAYVARLARIDLSDEELDRYRDQLGVILDHAARVQQLPTDGVEPTSHPLSMVNAFRPDEVRPSLERSLVLDQAPATEDGYIRVPPAMET
ncbi:aspartyl/glutamyl-tRNA(Asn/Gln) amidotransferase subunit C [bacterium BMS3Abin02]|nr:aspartyl/glutamyl-tRNA(Asn/Gln) amidotransferase subunit C [bacterium BMS3Abin02]GBE22767.1 aspartyl/glutamyl-tRNA(Asn/Gln) amidotransferase subunit C [bacterium BMS3Bbin01]HDK45410.1 Asp-tRNA(Asn)/Glu-tRNA(Gln) amidotransferase subunit GatC [Actinomycetota bacterium]HDL49194.1 Asp-tRNA(Asn)/Glu-tRNA(Gln) amidotransferase subunit GatC [Actinomycetota bacterium]